MAKLWKSKMTTQHFANGECNKRTKKIIKIFGGSY